ncbi:creatininase family protein [Microbacterium schleiferi]|uniref:Creatininase family protein n=1 Tax=Microbacterium schleiferi TaxID=69362 RepID=A0A7S8MX13_9MICO|nr:creatininase family protein [Microbacterium schleiferi]QPE04804.1 creatininase family protein [Microbacterium schleiferi]
MIELSSSTWPDIRDVLSAGPTVAVLPFGALEQHGPHLPLDTDTRQSEAIARDIAAALDAVLLPSIEYGNTWGNAAFPGTVSLSLDTVAAICSDIAASLDSSGFALLVVVNGDYGNRLPLQVSVEKRAASGARMPVLVLDYPGLTEIGDRVKESPWAAPGLCHADELETSMMLAISPATVHPERFVVEYPELPPDFGQRPQALAGLGETGVFGDPRAATAAKGRQILAHVVAESLTAIERTMRAIGIR